MGTGPALKERRSDQYFGEAPSATLSPARSAPLSPIHCVMFVNLAVALIAAMTLAPGASSPTFFRRDSRSWAGSNLYFLHALPAEEQSRYVQTLGRWSVKTLRLWGKLCPKPIKYFLWRLCREGSAPLQC